MGSSRPSEADIGTLHAVLESARAILDDLCRDGLLNRLVEAFLMLPEADRQPIVRVLERDATWRRIVGATAGTTGITVRPNPHASLYVHVLDDITGQPVEPGPLARDVEVIRIGIERFVPLLPLFFQEGVHAQWMMSARALLRDAPPELRSLGRQLVREITALLDEAEQTTDR